ncbi:helix-turn-helix domain-containing protein [Chitinophaga qingshengii]|uniref:AraC family transcriptional regulator n=1 Tax=Chitinophaga qingshengii TaxID=1569794 RepID=A0ABR7THE1_9BACT|nr:helix-turn-helix domain-containing protein [Chitinophaga qingshengii]MBC9928931.1 AraC family transcriptional regulator [Chitinophaga qingshengii]
MIKKTSYLPPLTLRPYIDRFWTGEGTTDTYPTLAAGTGAEMIFQLQAPMTLVSKDHSVHTPPMQALYCIRHQHYKAMMNQSHFFIAVRFKAGAIRHFLPGQVEDITETFADICLLYGDEGKRLTERLSSGNSLSLQLTCIGDFLLAQLQRHYRPHALVDEAITQLYYNREIPDLVSFSSSLGSSYRQFERLFVHHVGISPKSFQQTARLNNTLKHLLFHQIKDYLPVAFDYGYYDQSHFIRACRRFFGDKPRAILSPASQDQHFYFNASGSADKK